VCSHVAPVVAPVTDQVADRPVTQSVLFGARLGARRSHQDRLRCRDLVDAGQPWPGLYGFARTRARFNQSTRLVTSMLMAPRLTAALRCAKRVRSHARSGVLTPTQPHPARFAGQNRRCDATQREPPGYLVGMAKQGLGSALAQIIGRFLARVGLRPAGRTYQGDFPGATTISYTRNAGRGDAADLRGLDME
jgi:hypothetical protein